MTENSKFRNMVYLIGGVAGLLSGLAAAFLFIRAREQSDGDLKISSGQGVKIGMGIVSVLKMIADGGSK